MHSLQVIVRMNTPINQRSQAAAKALEIARAKGTEDLVIPPADRVSYEPR